MKVFYERIEKEQGISIKIHSVNEFKLHLHNEIELLMVLKGSIDVITSNEKIRLKENDFIIVNKNQLHSTRKVCQDNLCLAIQFNPTIIDSLYPTFSEKSFNIIDFYKRDKEEDILDKKDLLNKIHYHIASIVWEANKMKAGHEFDLGIHLLETAKLLINHFTCESITKDDSLPRPGVNADLPKIINYIESSIEYGVTLNEVAQYIEMSPSHFSRFFKKNIGITFQEYKNIRRLDKVEELLLNSNETITDIALSCGFSSAKSLNSMFNQYYNSSPSEYRKNKIDKLKVKTKYNYFDVNVDKNQNKSYFDVDRSAVFEKLFRHLDVSIKDKEDNKEKDIILRKIRIDLREESTPLKPYWKKLMTFGRASDGLRQDLREQLMEIQREIGFEYVRFHGIFSDDMMVCYLDTQKKIIYNWNYIDKLFDFLLKFNLKPFVELGFMPSELSSTDQTMFWWKANVSPPKDMKLWKSLIKEFISHCINRYGIEEVNTWKFEVWNEPELDIFWAGSKEDYFNFYKETVKTIKSISNKLEVGGPSITHQALKDEKWLEDFITYCLENQAPIDFITLHIYSESFSAYSDDKQDKKEDEIEKSGNQEDVKEFNDMINLYFCNLNNIYYDENHTRDTIKDGQERIRKTFGKELPLHITEWNATSFGRNYISDTCFIATFLVKNILQGIDTVESIGYWTFTDIMEELKSGISPFHGGFGLINQNGIKKPSYFSYLFLSKLGNEIIRKEEDYILTKKGEDFQILVYNLTYFDDLFLNGDISALTYKERYKIYKGKEDLDYQYQISNLSGNYKIIRHKLNPNHGSAFDEWLKIGSPENMTGEEINYLKGKAKPKMSIEYVEIEGEYNVRLNVPVHGLELVLIEKKSILR